MDPRKVDTALKVVNAVTRDVMTANKPAFHLAVSADRLVAMMLKAMLNKLRAVTQVEVRPVTVKARRADELDTDKAHRGIGADTLRIKVAISREEIRRSADIRHGHLSVVRGEPMAVSVHHVVIRIRIRTTSRHVVVKTINRQEHLSPSPPTMTSAEDVADSSQTTHRSRHSTSVPRVRLDPLDHVRLVRSVANDHNAAVMFPTMRLHSRDRREATRHSAVRLAARAVTDKREIANCRLVVEVSERLHRLVR